MNKKFLIILIILVPIFSIVYSKLNYFSCINSDTGFAIEGEKVLYRYYLDLDGQCANKEFEITEADSASFEDLGFNFGKDDDHVYRIGNVLFETFRLVENVDVDTYEVLNQAYKKDKNAVYWYDDIIDGADPSTFHLIGEPSLAKDENFLYQYGHRIEGADEKTYQALNYYYAIFNEVIYFTGLPMVDLEQRDYEILGENYIRIGNAIWYNDEEIEEVDVESFEILSDIYSKDKNAVYYFGEKMAGEDSALFKMPS